MATTRAKRRQRGSIRPDGAGFQVRVCAGRDPLTKKGIYYAAFLATSDRQAVTAYRAVTAGSRSARLPRPGLSGSGGLWLIWQIVPLVATPADAAQRPPAGIGDSEEGDEQAE